MNWIYKKKYIILFFFFMINCSEKRIGLQNKELTIRVVNDLTNEPMPNGKIRVKEIKKSSIGEYFWKSYPLLEKDIDDKGYAKIKIDSLGSYSILNITRDKGYSWYCSCDFEAKDIDFKKVYEIRCSDDFDKRPW